MCFLRCCADYFACIQREFVDPCIEDILMQMQNECVSLECRS